MKLLARCLVALLVAAPALGDGFPWLDTLDAGGEVRASGSRLMALPHGLHRLDRDGGETVTVAVHGWRSEGYEWVHLLKSLDGAETSVWFYRWDWNGCPGPAAAALVERLGEAPFRDMARVRVVGHSYGGVLAAAAAAQWPGTVELEVHAIAAPLAGVGERCEYRTPSALPENVAFRQWRTRHELDGAFRAMPEDPQQVDIPGAETTLLPATYNGRRLGHNWSVSWVADVLAGKKPTR